MVRSLCVFAVLLLVCAALAAPAPEPFVSGWGNPVNPDRDCKIKRDRGTLTIEMPGSDHDYDPIRGRFNAPRILRELEGLFDIQVRVQILSQPSAQSAVKGQPSFVSAGFLLIDPEADRSICSCMEFGVMQKGIGLDGYAVAPILIEPRRERASRNGIGEDGCAVTKHWYCKNQNSNMPGDRELLEQSHMIFDRGWQNWPLPRKADHAYLRLEAQGKWLTYFISPEGENWTQLTIQPRSPVKSKIGLAAFSTSSESFKVRFDQLKLTRGIKKKPLKEPLGGPSIYKS